MRCSTRENGSWSRAADLAHGLKTPLAALSGDARILRSRGSDDIADSLDAIGERMRRHVERELVRVRSTYSHHSRGDR
jgi:signal transduction histidine kinase